MALPQTAEQAVASYFAGENLEAIPLVKSHLAEQMVAWRRVFDLLLLSVQQGVHGTKMSYMQFESWCLRNKMAIPAVPDQTSACNAVKGAAYAILREGYGNFVSRHLPVSDRITIRKQN